MLRLSTTSGLLKLVPFLVLAAGIQANADITKEMGELAAAKDAVFAQMLVEPRDLAKLDKDLKQVAKIAEALLADPATTPAQRREIYGREFEGFWMGSVLSRGKYRDTAKDIKNAIVKEFPGSDLAAVAEIRVISLFVEGQSLKDFSAAISDYVKTYPKLAMSAGEVAAVFVVLNPTGRQEKLDACAELLNILPGDKSLLTMALVYEVSEKSAKDALASIAQFQKAHGIASAINQAASQALPEIRIKEGREVAIGFAEDVLKLVPSARSVKEALVDLRFFGEPAELSGPIFGSTKSFDISDYKGHVVIIDFFASWCAPCRRAAPKLAALLEKYSKDGVRVVGYSMDDSQEDLKKYLDTLDADLKQKNLPHWLTVHDSDVAAARKVANRYGVSGIPTFIVVGTDGKVVSPKLSFDEVELAVLQALGKAQ